MQSLREGILEAYVGIVTAFKNTDKTPLLLPHVQSMLDLCQRCLIDSERTESTVKLAIGLVGDLADTFPRGEIKQMLLAEWVATELRTRGRYSPELKRTIRWAREVRCLCLLMCTPCTHPFRV